MYGNAHLVADAIGVGLRAAVFDVNIVSVSQAGPAVLADADLVVVGGPTHAHGMSRASTRKTAVQAVGKPSSGRTCGRGPNTACSPSPAGSGTASARPTGPQMKIATQ